MKARAAALGLVALALLLTVAILFAPLAAGAQPAGEVPRIGVLLPGSPEGSHLAYALRDGLREFGYVEGRNIAIEWRWSSRARRWALGEDTPHPGR